jgi:hypothetical protein
MSDDAHPLANAFISLHTCIHRELAFAFAAPPHRAPLADDLRYRLRPPSQAGMKHTLHAAQSCSFHLTSCIHSIAFDESHLSLLSSVDACAECAPPRRVALDASGTIACVTTLNCIMQRMIIIMMPMSVS